MQPINPIPASNTNTPTDVHNSIGMLTRQLHDALNGLGLTDKVKGWADEIPDARSRLSYIARLTGEAAEKVLNQVDQAKVQHHHIAAETRRIGALIVKDPVGAVAKGHVMNFLTDVEASTQKIDQQLTEIMMAQDFHDLTGQVIAKVVNLVANVEEQLVELLIQTAPADAVAKISTPATNADHLPVLQGPVVVPGNNPDVVSGQSEVDDLLASLGF